MWNCRNSASLADVSRENPHHMVVESVRLWHRHSQIQSTLALYSRRVFEKLSKVQRKLNKTHLFPESDCYIAGTQSSFLKVWRLHFDVVFFTPLRGLGLSAWVVPSLLHHPRLRGGGRCLETEDAGHGQRRVRPRGAGRFRYR